MKEQKRNEKARQDSQRDGKVRVDVDPKANKTNFRGGEYVDYEEVK